MGGLGTLLITMYPIQVWWLTVAYLWLGRGSWIFVERIYTTIPIVRYQVALLIFEVNVDMVVWYVHYILYQGC